MWVPERLRWLLRVRMANRFLSLVLFLCSANNTSNRFLLPWTALRWVKECVYTPETTTKQTEMEECH